MGVTAADFDLDGYPDIYVANDKTENFLFHNERNGTFKEIAVAAGVAYGQNGENTSAMGPVFADFDHDGRVDLWVSDSKYNRLMKNTGKLTVSTMSPQRAGISQLAAQYVSWGTGAHDFDNDGLDDIFIVHGGLIHMVPQEHSVFRNLGGVKFEDVSRSAGPFFDVKSVGRGAAFADYDNDGKMDAFIVNLGAPAFLLHNTSPAHESLDYGEAGGAQEQPRRHRRAGGGAWRAACGSSTNGWPGRAISRRTIRACTSAWERQRRSRRLTVTWPSGDASRCSRTPPRDRVITIEEK